MKWDQRMIYKCLWPLLSFSKSVALMLVPQLFEFFTIWQCLRWIGGCQQVILLEVQRHASRHDLMPTSKSAWTMIHVWTNWQHISAINHSSQIWFIWVMLKNACTLYNYLYRKMACPWGIFQAPWHYYITKESLFWILLHVLS